MGWRYQAGLGLIGTAVFIWVASAEVTQKIFVQYKQPFVLTYLGVSLMVVYLPISLSRDWFCSLYRANLSKNLFGYGPDISSSDGLDMPLRINDMHNDPEAITDENLIEREDGWPLIAKGEEVEPQFLEQNCELGSWDIAKCSLYLAPIWFATEYLSNSALANTSVASTTVLTSTSGLFTLFFGALLGQETISTGKVVAVFVSMTGAAMTTVGKTWASDELLSTSEALSVVWTTPLVATLGMSLTIPLAMVADMVMHGRHYSAIYIFGCIQVFAGFVIANISNKLSPKTEL